VHDLIIIVVFWFWSYAHQIESVRHTQIGEEKTAQNKPRVVSSALCLYKQCRVHDWICFYS